MEIVRELEAEGHFPHAPYAFGNGVLSLPLTRLIEQQGKHRVSELERSRLIQWHGQWRRVDEVAGALREQHPESFRPVKVALRNGEEQTFAQPVKTIAGLLEKLAVPAARTAIELNGIVVEQQKIETTALQDADRIEIVSFVGGG